MVSALVSGSSGPGSSPSRGHCVMFIALGKTLSQCLSPRKETMPDGPLGSYADFSFHPEHSTESALISLADHILFDLDEDKISGMVFIDFGKAFDVVDHQLLHTKLRLYRVSDPSLLWFESYLSGRQRFVSIDGQRSDSLLIKQGVPQGNVLRPW